MIFQSLNQTVYRYSLKFLIEKDLKDKKFIQVLPQWTLKNIATILNLYKLKC